MYKIIITSRAERELRHLDKSVKNRVVSAIHALAENPRPHGCLKVKGEELGGFVLGTGVLVTVLMIKPGLSM
jgi:mRNA-degrading endonuclease RelE of RelBE toxin-antitoxin system